MTHIVVTIFFRWPCNQGGLLYEVWLYRSRPHATCTTVWTTRCRFDGCRV